MEPAYTVSILNNGIWSAPGPVIYSHPYARYAPVVIAQNFFLIQGDDRHILVDPGLDVLETYVDPEVTQGPAPTKSRSTTELLADHGLRPDDIDVLILTHLHFDHYVNAPLFKRARIILNRNEYLYVLQPEHRRYLPVATFPRDVFAWLVSEAWDRLDLVEGETEVLPDIWTIETGGHSPGHQIVTVKIAGETVVLPGDEVYMYANLEEGIPIGYYYDFEKHVRALDLVNRLGDHILPTHDPLVEQRYPTLRIPQGTADPPRAVLPPPGEPLRGGEVR